VGDRQLHLIVHPDTRTVRGTTEIDSRDGHYGLRVRSYRQTVEYLDARGVPHRDKPRNKTPWPQIYLTDPDGNVIELNAERLD
jgi:catechol 2,3-dioxygenase-like lactoylglutathione lyase family enzyme